MKYVAIIWITSLLPVHAYAAVASRAPISVSASLAKNELNVTADAVTINMKANGCSSFTDEIAVCNSGVRLTITNSSANIHQVIEPSAVFISNKYALYEGPLTDGGVRGTYSFLLSDVNGDGNDDLIVWTGRDGGYGGPSFDVYLFNAAEHKYVYSQAYSDLTVGSIRLFVVENRKVKTTAKDGCCTHVFETYQVESDEPKLIERVTESTSEGSGKISVKTERLIGDRMTVVPIEARN
ncbi:XAC2610-related protein [Dyella psychrodurans]|uniref:XAC2610-related protein n=1 Tax=Dyella psychrodurans TaxID=1927960 RepID=UPI0011C027F7|nr:FG-GAP repeat protein [Dyella psychrodurans]